MALVILHKRNGARKVIPVSDEHIPELRQYRFFPGDPHPWQVTGLEFPVDYEVADFELVMEG